MGCFCYLINTDKRIKCEAYQHSSSGNEINHLSNNTLPAFLEYCRENSLQIQCVHESFFEWEMDNSDENYVYYKEFELPIVEGVV